VLLAVARHEVERHVELSVTLFVALDRLMMAPHLAPQDRRQQRSDHTIATRMILDRIHLVTAD